MRCDEKAKNISLNQSSLELPDTIPQGFEICLSSPQGLILEKIYHHLASSLYMDYVQNHLQLSPHDLWRINWPLHGLIVKQARKRDENLVKKIIWKKHYTLIDQHRHGTHDSPLCPICGKEEDKMHFIRCEHIFRSKAGIKAHQQLRKEISNSNISPLLWNLIVSHLEDRPPLSQEIPNLIAG